MCSLRYGGAAGRKAAAAGAAKVGKPKGRSLSPPAKRPATATGGKASGSLVSSSRLSSPKPDENADTVYASARPAYMSEQREKEVLKLAERMQRRDLSGDVPVASFAYEIIQKHPSVRMMGLRERMDFLCSRWDRLPERKRLTYLNDPLKGLL